MCMLVLPKNSVEKNNSLNIWNNDFTKYTEIGHCKNYCTSVIWLVIFQLWNNRTFIFYLTHDVWFA